MAEQFPDSPSPEIATERARIIAIIDRWQVSPNAPAALSRVFTAIRNGYTTEQIATKGWGHPWEAQ